MQIFINRTLNLKKIKAVGFDMDYTLVRYHAENFERLSFQETLKKLIELKNYPPEIKKLKFNFQRAIRGLVIDKERGNLLKLSLYGKVKMAFHGHKRLDFKEQQNIYKGLVIDLNDPNIVCIDTAFSLSHAILYMGLVDFKQKNPLKAIPNTLILANDILEMIDLNHRDGTLKNKVAENVKKYIIIDPEIAPFLERLKLYGKKIFLITNSYYEYTRLLMESTVDPFLKNHLNWKDLFDVVITASSKPKFFTEQVPFMNIDANTGKMSNVEGKIVKGIYQGGCATQLQNNFNLHGEEILYLGDHIYGDILALKKSCNWRTALVMDEMATEFQALKKGVPVANKISNLMKQKEKLEHRHNQIYSRQFEKNKKIPTTEFNKLVKKMIKIDAQIGKYINFYEKLFNPYWGEVMRAGQEESRFAGQVEKYACIYMAKATDLGSYSPRTYFRPKRRLLAHEQEL